MRFLLMLSACGLLLSSWTAAAESTIATASVEPASDGRTNKVWRPVQPGPADGRIAYVTARLLEQLHLTRQPFGDDVSSKLLDEFLKAMDPQHLHFTQEDLAQFESLRTNLDQLTISLNFVADTSPACEIFNRFVERLTQRVTYNEELLRNEKFTFAGDERVLVNRREAPYPKDLEEAHQLWRERLRFEYLQEKLGKMESRKKAAGTKKKDSKSPQSLDEEVVETLSHRYQRNLKNFRDWDNESVLQVYLSTLSRVYDPHSDYMGREQLESFAIGMNLSLFGIGAELQSDDGYCVIRRLLPEGPAEKSKKIQVNDRIVAVAQGNQAPVDVVDMSLSKAVQLIRGPKGTEVRLTIWPAGEASSARKVVSIIRDEINLKDQAAKARLIELPGSDGEAVRLGIIDLPSFYAAFDPMNTREKSEPRSTAADVAKLITKLKKENVNGLILDLRRNGGGSLEEAIRVTGLFIKQGPVVQVRDTDGSVQTDEDTDPRVLYDGPLVVLTSRFSASASEIVAGALQDYGRALIVGDASTHGKGTVQSVHPLRPYMKVGGVVLTNEPGALKVTIKKFYRASGASTQLRGVAPDIILPSVFNESKEIGESALEHPLPWDTIPSAHYDGVDMVSPFLPELAQRSAKRVAEDKDFAYVREDIQQFKKMQADKTVSLNEAQRLKEKEEADARQKARDKERLARTEPNEKAYELTLEAAGKPGLPPMVQKTNAVATRATGSGASTNAELASASDSFETPDLDSPASEEDKSPAVDPALAEARHILVDYLSLLPRQSIANAARTAQQATADR